MRPLFIFCLTIILLDACIEPFDIDTADVEATLVVEGMITDQPGPYSVKLTYTNSLDDQLDMIRKVQGAAVVIYDNQGNSERLKEITPGFYQTKVGGIQGVVGNEYYVRITLSDNSIYESEPEKLTPSGEIEKIYYEFDQQVERSAENFLEPKNGFKVYVDGTVLPEQDGLVRWRTIGTWEIRTFPDRKVRYESGPRGNIIVVPDPPLCSGWSVNRRSGIVTYVGPCQCCNCWVSEYDKQPILSDALFQREKVTKQLVTFIPASRRLFYNKYHIQVEQMSVSQKIYDFWETVKKQRQTGSDLFQTPPPKSLGNIHAVSGNEKALGYFGASSVKLASLFIERTDIPYYVPPIDTIPESCTLVNRFSTTTKPFFW